MPYFIDKILRNTLIWLFTFVHKMHITYAVFISHMIRIYTKHTLHVVTVVSMIGITSKIEMHPSNKSDAPNRKNSNTFRENLLWAHLLQKRAFFRSNLMSHDTGYICRTRNNTLFNIRTYIYQILVLLLFNSNWIIIYVLRAHMSWM